MALDAIVLLGCRLRPDGRLGVTAERRAMTCAAAFRERGPCLILVSGGRRWYGTAEAAALRQELVNRHGLPPDAIVTELWSLSTAENARYSAALLRSRGLSSVGVVTCEWHLPRALANFRAAGVEAVGIPVKAPPVGVLRGYLRWARERCARILDRWATWGITGS